MPFSRPTLTDLRAQVASDINAALPGVDALLRYSHLGILGDVLAALASGHYEYADWIALQSAPFTATGEYLEGWAALKGVTRKAAAGASGQVSFPASNGATVPAGTGVNRNDGASYVVTSDAVAANGAALVNVQAVKGGAVGNALVGTAMTLFAGISGVSVSGRVTAALSGGADLETDAQLRTRMLAAYASPPQGGSITDYPNWALAVPGVTRAWVQPAVKGPGTLTIYFMMDVVHAAGGGFPVGTDGVSSYETRDTVATGDQLAVADAVFPKQSVCALVYVTAPVPNNLGLAITLPGATSSTKNAVANALYAALLVNAVPGGVTNVSALEAAIASVPAAAGAVLTNISASAGTVGNGGTGNITSNAGALPWLQSITWS